MGFLFPCFFFLALSTAALVWLAMVAERARNLLSTRAGCVGCVKLVERLCEVSVECGPMMTEFAQDGEATDIYQEKTTRPGPR